MTKLEFFWYSKINIYGHTVRKSWPKVKQTEWNAYFDWYLEASLKTVEQKKAANSLSLILSLPLIFSSIWIAWPDAVSLFFYLFQLFYLLLLPCPQERRIKTKQKLWSNILTWHLSHSLTAKMILCLSLPLQFSSVAWLCPNLCNLMDYSTPGLPVHHQLPEFTQTHVHRYMKRCSISLIIGKGKSKT